MSGRIVITGDVGATVQSLGSAPVVDAVEVARMDGIPTLPARGRLIVSNLSQGITPGNRANGRWEGLFNGSRSLEKISVSDRLFCGNDPWRLWFHWGICSLPFDGYTYSYLLETHYRAWIDGARENNPISVDNVLKNARGVFQTMPDAHTPGAISDRVICAGSTAHADYQREKRRAFAECSSAKQIIKRLGDFAQRVVPERFIPQVKDLFVPGRPEAAVATDFAVDRYLMEHLRYVRILCVRLAEETAAAL